MTERELQNAVIDAARLLGWRVAHFRSVPVKRGPRVIWQTPVQADGAGFPDLVLVRERILWRELKVDKGRISEDQYAWIAALNAAGEDAGIWRAEDWHAGRIEAELRHHDPKEAAAA